MHPVMSGTAVTRLLVIDDHPVVRQGIRTFLRAHPEIEVIGEAGTGRDAVMAAVRLQPDVALLDLDLPDMESVELIRRLRQRCPSTRLLAFGVFADDHQVLSALRAGARGYLLKDVSSEELAHAVQAVMRGETPLHPLVARRLMEQIIPPSEQTAVAMLTPREREVLRLLGAGMSNKEIARAFYTSDRSVKHHITSIFHKLGVERRTQAAVFAARLGLGQPAH